MQKLLLYIFLATLLPVAIQAQTWVGGGDGTSWNDSDNWNPNDVPAAGSMVTIGTNATITGTVSDIPSQVRITGSADVTLNFSTPTTLTNGTDDAIIVSGTSSLTIASDVTVAGSSTKRAVEITNGTDVDDSKYGIANDLVGNRWYPSTVRGNGNEQWDACRK